MSAFDYFLIAWWLLSIFLMIAMIGKPRKPTEPLTAAISCAIVIGLIVGLLITRGAL